MSGKVTVSRRVEIVGSAIYGRYNYGVLQILFTMMDKLKIVTALLQVPTQLRMQVPN